jgi:hypothetical protein
VPVAQQLQSHKLFSQAFPGYVDIFDEVCILWLR